MLNKLYLTKSEEVFIVKIGKIFFLFLLLGVFFLSTATETKAQSLYFNDLYGQPVPESILDGIEKSFLVNGYSTSHSPSAEEAWPAVLQKMLDEHTGVMNPQDRIYHVFSFTKGSTPIAKWTVQEGDLGCSDGTDLNNAIAKYVSPGSGVPTYAPNATILLAQQSLQYAFDCNVRGEGIANENDIERIDHGVAEIEHYVNSFRSAGIETVYLSKHIYQKNELALPTFTEKYAFIKALDVLEGVRPGPYLWDATKAVWPEGYQSDGRHPNVAAANTMAVYWYLVLAGEDANSEIVAKYANQYIPATHIPSVEDPPLPVAEKITNIQVASGQPYQLIIDDDPFGYGAEFPIQPYIENKYQIVSAPTELYGETYIKTSLADSTSVNDNFLSFDVDQNVSVYVLHPNDVPQRPNWLSSFEDTGVDIHLSKSTYLRVFKKDFSPGTVVLGGNEGTPNNKMYSVIIKNHEIVDESPIANPDSYTVDEDFVLDVDSSIGVLFNDEDPEGATISAELITSTVNGMLTFNEDGSFVYAPTNDFHGQDQFIYRATDGNSYSQPVEVLITINPVNDPPIAVDDTASTMLDNSVQIDVLANDLDPDNDDLFITELVQPASGSAVLNSDNTITYTPNLGFGDTDSFSYVASDGEYTDTGLVTVAINNPPIADDQEVVLDEDTQIAITLTATDADYEEITYSILSEPLNGVLSGTAPHVMYTPNPDFNGTDSFEFVAEDSSFGSDTGIINITVQPVNDPPVSEDVTVNTEPETEVVIQLSASDVDGDSLTYMLVGYPLNGTITSDDGDDHITYTPNSGFSGTDTFSYKSNDGLVDSNISTVTVNVESPELVDIVNVSSGLPYEFSTVSLNELVYIDHGGIRLNSIDPIFEGQTLIRTSYNDRDVSTANHLTLLFGQQADVYIAFDQRISRVPQWMEDGTWILVPESVGTSYASDSPRKVYKKTFDAGVHMLGGNDKNYTSARLNYFVIIVPSSL